MSSRRWSIQFPSMTSEDRRHAALTAVWRDIEATVPGLLVAEERADMIVLRQPDGSSVGLPKSWEDFPAQVPQLVTEGTQEAAIEALWATGRSACQRRLKMGPVVPTEKRATLWSFQSCSVVVARPRSRSLSR